MSGALWYLIRTSARNRLRRQLQRLRTPRYALAFVLGILYLWFFLFRQGGDLEPWRGQGMEVVAGLFGVLVVGYLAWSWVFGTDRTALAFSRAEVAMLFPAPITRRALILYKLARSQLGILLSVVVWSVLLNRGGDAATSLMRGVGLWTAITTLSLHRLGIGLRRAGAAEHGADGVVRSLPALAVTLAAVGAVAWGFGTAWPALQAADSARATLLGIQEVLESAPAAWALWPIRVAFAPVVAHEWPAWFAAIGPALLLLALHVWWVLASDSAFEEAAAEASERQAKLVEQMRTRRGGGAIVRAQSVRRTLPLAARGHAAVAIVWKNALWVLRTHQLRGLLLPPVLLLAAVLAFGGDGRTGTILGVLPLVWTAMLFVFGPMSMRNDLRSDLLHLPMLKTLPIAGREVVLAQVMSGALTIALPQVLLLVVSGVAALRAPAQVPLPAQAIPGVLVAAPPLLLALNAAHFSLHNGLALLFPGWVKLGERGPSGIEATGQMMLTSIATLLGLALLLFLPAVGATMAFVAARAELGTGVLLAGLVAAALLALETWAMIHALGGAFERVEPMHLG